jgi:N-acetylglucosaminyl-diphospho-decaprenol L-rhamnosyltransferase
MSELKKSTVDIILVNWNGGEQLEKAIKPLLPPAVSSRIDIKIIISDNGSTDNSLDLISSLPVVIIKNGQNLGFGAACNRVLPLCTGEFVLLLNVDTEATLEVIEHLVEKISESEKYGTIGPRQTNAEGKTHRSCGRFPNFLNSILELTGLSKTFPYLFTPSPIMLDWKHNCSREVDHVIGSCMLIRRSVINTIGFMDENYFVYLEDLDFSKRVTIAGYKNFYFHDVAIYHEGGGLSKKAMTKRLYYSLSSKIYYWKKHFNPLSYYTLLFLALSIEPVIRVGVAMLTFKRETVKQTLAAYRYLFKELFYKVEN